MTFNPLPNFEFTKSENFHPGLINHKKHLATSAAIGTMGGRVGTNYAHSPIAVRSLYGDSYFRFRNSECEGICREAWALPVPEEGDLFIVAPESADLSTSSATYIEAVDPRRKCPLVKWEYAALPFGRTRFYRYARTHFYQHYTTSNGFTWNARGRVLLLKPQYQGLFP